MKDKIGWFKGMKYTHLNIYPSSHTWKQRFTVIFSTLLGKPYHMTVNEKTIKELVARIK